MWKSREGKEDEEQGRRCHGTNMSTYQVDPNPRPTWPVMHPQK